MRYLSLFSGIEAASAAWHDLGWEPVAFAEIEPLPCAHLATRFPGVPNLGDVTEISEAQIAALGRVDVVVFGSPCQDLSLAGKRKGLAGARSGLFFHAVRVVRDARLWGGCRWALWENVPGAFTSNEGRDFAVVVGELAGMEPVDPPEGKRWGTEGAAVGEDAMVEWATLDAQWFGVAQRRRRVFAVADSGRWADRPPVLLEPQSLRGDSAPSREAGARVTPPIAGCSNGGGANGPGRTADDAEFSVALCPTAGGMRRLDAESETLLPVTAYRTVGNGDVFTEGDKTSPLTTGTDRGANILVGEPALTVRRLTVRECERLQGFTDDWTAVSLRGKPAADGPRYKAIGNSMAVPVMRWIGQQIDTASRF